MPSACQILHVVLVGIGLTLEAYRSISPMRLEPRGDKSCEPFHDVPQIKAHIQGLLHLRRMYGLVIDVYVGERSAIPYKP